MAGDWMKFEKATLDKPEVFEMAGILGIDPDAVIGKLLRVWDWFDDQSVDGYAPVTLAAQLNRNTGCDGFTDAMQKVGWLEVENERLKIPNFTRHNGQTAKDRALSAKRMAKSRQKSCANGYANGATSAATKTQPEKRREELHSSYQKNDRAKFEKPTVEEVKEYGTTLNPPFVRAQAFHSYYESNGWKVGRNPMKDWKSAVRSWHAKDNQNEKSETEYTSQIQIPIIR